MKSLLSANWVKLLVLSGFIINVGCDDSSWIDQPDYLEVDMEVVANDGKTPLAGVEPEYYDWVAELKDGSTIMRRIEPTGVAPQALKTDQNGTCGFNTDDLNLESGILHESCSNVCVQSVDVPGYYEDQCGETCWTGDCTEDCTEDCWDECGETCWEECDEWGCWPVCEPYCDTYCDTTCNTYCDETCEWSCSEVWVPGYSECVAYGEVCNYYYPSRDFSDVVRAWGEVGIKKNNAVHHVKSDNVTLRKDGQVDKRHWSQSDRFVTPLETPSKATSSKIASNLERVKKMLVAERKKSGKYRSRKSPRIFKESEIDQMTPGQRATYDAFLKKNGLKK